MPAVDEWDDERRYSRGPIPIDPAPSGCLESSLPYICMPMLQKQRWTEAACGSCFFISVTIKKTPAIDQPTTFPSLHSGGASNPASFNALSIRSASNGPSVSKKAGRTYTGPFGPFLRQSTRDAYFSSSIVLGALIFANSNSALAARSETILNDASSPIWPITYPTRTTAANANPRKLCNMCFSGGRISTPTSPNNPSK
jgi:hypothetical protein